MKNLEMMMDEFDRWNEIKKRISQQPTKNVSIGKIYWVSIGQNVGSELYGKAHYFTRPVLVINKMPSFTNLFLGIPLSSQIINKSGFMYHKFIDSKDKTQVACLAQMRIFNAKIVQNHFNGKISKEEFSKIKKIIKSKIIK